MKSILDPTFRYTSSVDTDLRKTFARVRKAARTQQRVRAAAQVQVQLEGGGEPSNPTAAIFQLRGKEQK